MGLSRSPEDNSTVQNQDAPFLAAVFEMTHSPADFLQADNAFRKQCDHSGLTPRELLCWAEINQLMMGHCAEQALALFAQISEGDDPICRTARRRQAHLLIRLGKSAPELDAYLQSLAQSGTDPEEWLELICTLHEYGHADEALRWLDLARERFPEHPMVFYWGGVICQAHKRWQKALEFWERLLTLDPAFTDAVYGCAECREQLGDFQAAFTLWNSLAKQTESDYPKKQAIRCRKQLDSAFV